MLDDALKTRLNALPRTSAALLIRGYQLLLSPMMGTHCRFYPCCSNYALEALDTHGFCKGAWLSVKRIARCHPYSSGGHDPVPVHQSRCPK
jgi:uncharacterized protein